MSTQIPVKELPSDGEQFIIDQGTKVYTRRIQGFYQRLRRYISAPLLLAFFLLPWMSIDQRPAIYLDLSEQKFHVFWLTFWPQDGLLLAWLLIIAALGLFVVTVWAGRVWCGFSCPQTIWTQMFIWIEDKCEGDRAQRIKLDAKGWTSGKLLRKSTKQLLWLLLASATSFTFIAYFYNAYELVNDIVTFSIGIEAIFWLGLFALLTYLNAGWMREQVCKHMCPYARFQSVMYDDDTQVVTYDAARGDSLVDKITGEPVNKRLLTPDSHEQYSPVRLARSAKTDHQAQGLGDCIDCSWCVQVCPVDIDIRDGIQADCINCGLCIDACDSVMDKLDYPRGLIRFSSENAMRTPNQTQSWKPSGRFLAYGAILLVCIGLFSTQLGQRSTVNMSILRDRGVHLYHERHPFIENVYLLRISNMSREAKTFSASVEPPYQLTGKAVVYLEEGEVFNLPVRVRLEKNQISHPQQDIVFHLSSISGEPDSIKRKASFISPPKLSSNR